MFNAVKLYIKDGDLCIFWISIELNCWWTQQAIHPSSIHPTSRTITQPYIISLWACMYTADRWEMADFPTTWVRLPLLSPLLEALNTFLTSQFSPINRQTSTCSQITQTLQQLRFFFFLKRRWRVHLSRVLFFMWNRPQTAATNSKGRLHGLQLDATVSLNWSQTKKMVGKKKPSRGRNYSRYHLLQRLLVAHEINTAKLSRCAVWTICGAQFQHLNRSMPH